MDDGRKEAKIDLAISTALIPPSRPSTRTLLLRPPRTPPLPAPLPGVVRLLSASGQSKSHLGLGHTSVKIFNHGA